MPAAEATGRTPPRGGWADMLWGTSAILVLLAGFTTVVQGADWFVSTALVCVLVATATIVLRQLGARRIVAPIALVTEVVVLSWVFVPATLIVLIPTSATVAGLRDLIEQAGPIIAQEQSPVAASTSIVLVLAAAFGALVVLVDVLIQLRQGVVLLGALLLAIYITPSLITGTSPSGVLFVVAAALWLIMLRRRTAVVRVGAGQPRRVARQVPALVLGLGGLVAALIFPAVSPNISSVAASWGNPPPQVFGPGINPIVELGTNLRRNTPVPVMTLTTTLDDPPYLKVATLPNFTGRTWRPAENFNDGRFEGQLAVRDGISADRASTRISVSKLRSDLLPVPYPTIDIGGLEGSYQVERTGLTVKLRGSDITGQTYTAQSIDVQPTAEQLRAADPRVTPDLRRYTELEDAPPIIADTANQVTQDATNNYDRAIALQNYFRSGEFDYSETAPVAEDYDGNGLAVIAEFLQRKAGYCVHFSSAMAVMARSLGIPSRVAVGYAPGGLTGEFDGGRRVYEVMSDDLHAWTELYFDGAGWVRFDPTPGIGEGTAFSEPTSATPDPTTPEAGADDAQPEPQQNPRSEDGAQALGETQESTSTAPRSAAAVALALLAIILLPGLARVLRRTWRLRQAEPDRVWREIEDTARDFGVLASVADTPRGLARRVAARPGLDTTALSRLLDLVERRRYSPDTVAGDEAAGEARIVIDSLQEGASRLERARAALLPRSLGPRSAVSAPVPGPVT